MISDWRDHDGPTHFTKAAKRIPQSECNDCHRLTLLNKASRTARGMKPFPYTCTSCWVKAHIIPEGT